MRDILNVFSFTFPARMMTDRWYYHRTYFFMAWTNISPIPSQYSLGLHIWTFLLLIKFPSLLHLVLHIPNILIFSIFLACFVFSNWPHWFSLLIFHVPKSIFCLLQKVAGWRSGEACRSCLSLSIEGSDYTKPI